MRTKAGARSVSYVRSRPWYTSLPCLQGLCELLMPYHPSPVCAWVCVCENNQKEEKWIQKCSPYLMVTAVFTAVVHRDRERRRFEFPSLMATPVLITVVHKEKIYICIYKGTNIMFDGTSCLYVGSALYTSVKRYLCLVRWCLMAYLAIKTFYSFQLIFYCFVWVTVVLSQECVLERNILLIDRSDISCNYYLHLSWKTMYMMSYHH